MKIKKSKTAVKTVTAKKVPAVKSAPKAKKPAEKAVAFTFNNDKGLSVYIAGTFNNWNVSAKKMTEKKNGLYTATLKLAPGRYEYKFVVNGTWCQDPANADFVANDQGTFNSVLVVK